MTELRFRTDLYAAEAIDRTVAAYESFATIERESFGEQVILRVTAPAGVDEAELAGEIANYVLGVTVDQRTGKELGS
jgi:hypothetical protein